MVWQGTVAVLVTLLGALPVAAHTPANPPYKVSKTIPLGPGEHWDYVTCDPTQGGVYVAHGDHVSVVNLSSGVVIGSIGPLPGGTHGIAVSLENNIGFTDDGKAGIAAAFVREESPERFLMDSTVMTWPSARSIGIDPATGRLFLPAVDISKLELL